MRTAATPITAAKIPPTTAVGAAAAPVNFAVVDAVMPEEALDNTVETAIGLEEALEATEDTPSVTVTGKTVVDTALVETVV